MCESILYRERVLEVLKKQIVMCPREESRRCSMAEKNVLNSMDTIFFNTLEIRRSLRVLGISADRVFWMKESSDLPR